ncbi:hypothetical protein GF318_03450 [Candidatus Micrarchaeota archaeon]|nr:hypothetical protein [Candidatus Micrarchaeota archaeon]
MVPEIKKNLLLSTDIGTDIDDAAALYLAMNSPAIDLKGVYVTNGPVGERARIARHLLELGGHGAVVGVGEAEAMFSRLPRFTTGAEHFMAPGKGQPDAEEDWLSMMAGQLERLKDAVVASIAPLTNIARLLREKPGAVKSIRTLYIMGGREGKPEHNFSHDSLAADEVLNSGMDMVVVPAGVCGGFRPEAGFLTGLKGSRAQGFIACMASCWKLFHDTSNIFTPQLVGETRHMLPLVPGKRMSHEDFGRLERFRSLLAMLCNSKNFREDPVRHYRIFQNVMELAGENPGAQPYSHVLNAFRLGELKKMRVSDAFAIYAIEHPKKIKTEQAELRIDDLGIMNARPGKKHRLVAEVDYGHFRNYFKKRMQAPAKPRRLVR